MSCDPPEKTRTPRTIGVVYRSEKRTLRTAPTSVASCEWKYAASRVMFPSTSSSTTMSAWLMPWCGRPAGALSSFTASARRVTGLLAVVGMPVSGQHSVHAAFASSVAGVTHASKLHASVRGAPTTSAFERRTPTCVEPSSSELTVARSPKPYLFQSPATSCVCSHGIENGVKYAIPLGLVKARLLFALNACTRTEPLSYQ